MTHPLPFHANDPRTVSQEVREEISQLERNIVGQFAQNNASHLLPQSLWNVQVLKFKYWSRFDEYEEIPLDRVLVVDIPLDNCTSDTNHQNVAEIISSIASKNQTHLCWPAARAALERKARGVHSYLPSVTTFDSFWSDGSMLRAFINKCEADCGDLERIKAHIDEAAGRFITDYHEELVYQDETNPSNAPYYLSQLRVATTGHSDPNLDRTTADVLADYWMAHQVIQSLIDSTRIQRGQAETLFLDLVVFAVVASIRY